MKNFRRNFFVMQNRPNSGSAYAVQNKQPGLVTDFLSGQYRKGQMNVAAEFADLATFSRAGNATMVDSDGLIKWAPHNLLSYSEDISAVPWTTTNVTIDSATQFTFDTASGYIRRGITLPKGEYTLKVTLSGSHPGDTFNLELVDSADGSDSNVTVVTVPSEPTEFTVVADLNTATFSGSAIAAINRVVGANSITAGSTITIERVHLYRSDLGGMAPVPFSERGLASSETYLPTAPRLTGPELVTNGTFDTDANWTKGTGWTISGGTANLDTSVTGAGVLTSLAQDITTVAGQSYVLSVDVTALTNVTINEIFIRVDGATIGKSVTSTGTEVRIFVASGTTTTISIDAGSGQDGDEAVSIDSISFRETTVDPRTARYLPRIGHHVYDGTSWVNQGLLLESEARTNLITYSEDFTDASWTKSNSSLASDLTGLGGSPNSAYTLSDDNSGGTGPVAIRYSVAVSTSTSYTFSVFLVAKGVDQVRVGGDNFTTPANGGTLFSLSAGEVVSNGSGYSGAIEDYGNGWYRCSTTFTTDASDTTGLVTIYLGDGSGGLSLTLDGSNSVGIYGVQLEEGSTPSSYIPTSGATATRAAETLTIPAANLPYPEPNVIGPELVTNGTFDTDSDWTKEAGWTIGAGVASYSTDTGRELRQTISTTAGKSYLVTWDVVNHVSQAVGVYSLESLQTTVGDYNGDANGSYSRILVATGSSMTVRFRTSNPSAGLSLDNTSFREIDPLSVSIAMEGTMTYADTGTAREVDFLRWRETVNDRLEAYLSTASADTGQFIFTQAYDGTIDTVQSAFDACSPGINIPFSIASRYGSTFINGAVDGTALTEDTTPVALPDLSATDLSLGLIFMGTIKTFRMWADDIGDTGLEQAS